MSDRRRTSRYLKGKQTDKEFSRHLWNNLVQQHSNTVQTVTPNLLSLATDTEGLAVLLTFDINMANPAAFTSDFTLKVGSSEVDIDNVALEIGTKIITVYPVDTFNLNEVITVSIASGNIKSASGGVLAAITDQAVTNNAVGTKYYVSNTGSDTATGKTQAEAWQTVAKVNGSLFVPGDRILFEKDGVWREQLTVPSEGTSDHVITFGCYGTGNMPQILGSLEINEWTQIEQAGNSANNDVFSEDFSGTGFQNAGWTKRVGTNTGSLVNEDATDVTPPIGGTQTLHIVKTITPTASSEASQGAIYRDYFASNVPISYTDFYINIHSYSLPSVNNSVSLLELRDGSNNTAFQFILQNVSGVYRFVSIIYNNGGYEYVNYPTSTNITLDHWYHFQMKYDVTNMMYSLSVDNNEVISNTNLTGTVRDGIQRIFIGDYDSVRAIDFHFSNLNISSTNFYTEAINTPANVWKSVGAVSDPYALVWQGNTYFKETNGDISWGKVKVANKASLASEYQWEWESNHIYIYSPTDPNTRYSGVEVTQINRGIHLNDKNYIKIDGIELAYQGVHSIGGDANPSTHALYGLTVQNCHIHHVGIKTSGYCVWSYRSNSVYKNNEIHDSGRRGISLNMPNISSPSFDMENIIVEGNTFYNGFHTTGLDIINSGSGTMRDILVQKNYFYDDPTLVIDGTEVIMSNLMYVQATPDDPDHPGLITDLHIYDNIFVDNTLNALRLVTGISDVYIYNNTFKGVNPTMLEGGIEGILTLGGVSNARIKNNIIYNNVNHAVNPSYVCLNVDYGLDPSTVIVDNNLYYHPIATQNILFAGGNNYNSNEWTAWKNAGYDINSPNPSDPMFISSSDYHLQSGSPAINAGVDVGLTTGYEGNPLVGLPDIGAYEKQ